MHIPIITTKAINPITVGMRHIKSGNKALEIWRLITAFLRVYSSVAILAGKSHTSDEYLTKPFGFGFYIYPETDCTDV